MTEATRDGCRAPALWHYKGVGSVRTTPSWPVMAVLACLASPLAAQTPPPATPAAAPAPVPLSALPVTPRAAAALEAPAVYPPALGAGHVVLALDSGHLAAFRLGDASEVWRVAMTADQPPVIAGDAVLVAAGGAVHALDVGSGAVAWRAETGPVAAPLCARDGWVIVSARQLFALRATDGSTVWSHDAAPLAAAATIEGNRLYLPLQTEHVEARGLAAGEVLWTRRLGGRPDGVLAFPDRVFVGSADGYFSSLDAASGDIRWRFRVGAALRGAPAAHGSLVHTVSLDNLVRAYDRGHGARVWSKGIPYRGLTGPLVVDGSLVVPGLDGSLPVFAAETGAAQAPLVFESPLVVPVTLGEDRGVRVLAAVVGDLASGWRLVLRDGSYAAPLAPLTALPGEVLPLPAPVKPPARP